MPLASSEKSGPNIGELAKSAARKRCILGQPSLAQVALYRKVRGSLRFFEHTLALFRMSPSSYCRFASSLLRKCLIAHVNAGGGRSIGKAMELQPGARAKFYSAPSTCVTEPRPDSRPSLISALGAFYHEFPSLVYRVLRRNGPYDSREAHHTLLRITPLSRKSRPSCVVGMAPM
jgi:hypothetical protein